MTVEEIAGLLVTLLLHSSIHKQFLYSVRMRERTSDVIGLPRALPRRMRRVGSR